MICLGLLAILGAYTPALKSFPSCLSTRGVAAPAGHPVFFGAGGAAGLAWDGRLAAVPALAEFPASLQAFLCIEPLVLYALWTLVPGLVVLPAVFVCVASLGRGGS